MDRANTVQGTRCGQDFSSGSSAGHYYQAREIASARSETDGGLAMMAGSFSPQSRT